MMECAPNSSALGKGLEVTVATPQIAPHHEVGLQEEIGGEI